MSIRLKSGGHSFSTAELDAIRESTHSVNVVVLTAKTTIVPAELFDSTHIADYLAEVGLTPSISEIAVSTLPHNGMVAIIAMNRYCYDELIQVVAAGVTFSTPLLDNETIAVGCIIHLEEDVLYVRVYNHGLRFAEAMRCKTDADILYYLASINEAYSVYNMYARATGDVKRLQRLCKKIFKELCE